LVLGTVELGHSNQGLGVAAVGDDLDDSQVRGSGALQQRNLPEQ
jgi:hypothetical protein